MQYGLGKAGGADALFKTAQHAAHALPGRVVVSLDACNAFGTLLRHAAQKALSEATPVHAGVVARLSLKNV